MLPLLTLVTCLINKTINSWWSVFESGSVAFSLCILDPSTFHTNPYIVRRYEWVQPLVIAKGRICGPQNRMATMIGLMHSSHIAALTFTLLSGYPLSRKYKNWNHPRMCQTIPISKIPYIYCQASNIYYSYHYTQGCQMPLRQHQQVPFHQDTYNFQILHLTLPIQ